MIKSPYTLEDVEAALEPFGVTYRATFGATRAALKEASND